MDLAVEFEQTPEVDAMVTMRMMVRSTGSVAARSVRGSACGLSGMRGPRVRGVSSGHLLSLGSPGGVQGVLGATRGRPCCSS